MSDPQTLADYNRLCHENMESQGFGVETSVTVPCPFCAARGFMTYRIVNTRDAMKRGATCKHCGRSGAFEFLIEEPSAAQFMFVQTGGPDPPPYLYGTIARRPPP